MFVRIVSTTAPVIYGTVAKVVRRDASSDGTVFCEILVPRIRQSFVVRDDATVEISQREWNRTVRVEM
jgi:hypothetical protein